MSNVQEVLDSQRQIEDRLLSRMTEFEKQLKASSSDNKPTLEKLTREFGEFKNSVWSVLTNLRSLVHSLLLRVDDLDTQSRQNALLFSGIKESESEENCMALLIDVIHSQMNLTSIDSSSFLVCHRLGSKRDKANRPILVRFTSCSARDLIWREKKKLKGSSAVVSEFLTKSKQDIFSLARKHFGMRCCWTQWGQVFVKLPDNDRKRISSSRELDLYMSKFPAPVLEECSSEPQSAVKPASSSSLATMPISRRHRSQSKRIK